MSLIIRIFTLVLVLGSCTQNVQKLHKKQYYVFGTLVEVIIWHDNLDDVEASFNDVGDMLNSMHTQWHAWKQGRLQEINTALRKGSSIELSEYETEFIKETQELSSQSLNYFNPAIGELIHLWGFHTDDYPITTPPPDQSEINMFLSDLPQMQDLVFEGNRISSKNDSIWLDFGGVAKGHAIDMAIEILQKNNINNAIVNAGGDLRSIGQKGNDQWRVAVRKPNSKDVFTVIEVDGDESVFTSGNYERYKQFNGKRYAHIINPKTGAGVDKIVSATVIAQNGTLADAAATALIIADEPDRVQVIRNLGLTQALLIEDDGKCFYTPDFQKRVLLDCEVIDIQ